MDVQQESLALDFSVGCPTCLLHLGFWPRPPQFARGTFDFARICTDGLLLARAAGGRPPQIASANHNANFQLGTFKCLYACACFGYRPVNCG
jgi:hypothetical protein